MTIQGESMTDAPYTPGDVVNGHRLTVQSDGSQVWLPVEVGVEHKLGDIVNGHRLTEDNGSLVWLPLAADAKSKQSRLGLWVAVGAVGALLLIITIVGGLNWGARLVASQVTANNLATEVAVEPTQS